MRRFLPNNRMSLSQRSNISLRVTLRKISGRSQHCTAELTVCQEFVGAGHDSARFERKIEPLVWSVYAAASSGRQDLFSSF